MELLAFSKPDIACKEWHWIAFHLSFPLHPHTASRISFIKYKNDTLLPGSKDLNCLPSPRWKLRSEHLIFSTRWSYLPRLPQIYILLTHYAQELRRGLPLMDPGTSSSRPSTWPPGLVSMLLPSAAADSCPSWTGLPDSPAWTTGRDTVILNFLQQNSDLSYGPKGLSKERE